MPTINQGYTLEELKALVFNLDIINGLDIKNIILEIIDTMVLIMDINYKNYKNFDKK